MTARDFGSMPGGLRPARDAFGLYPPSLAPPLSEQVGAGTGAFFTPTGYGTLLAEGKETRVIDGRNYVLEYPIRADFALIKALRGDRWGNLVYRKTARNFGPIMASAAMNGAPTGSRGSERS